MDTITFDKLLLKTAFCCMASDGVIDDREITLIKTMCENSPLFNEFDFQTEINLLVEKINTRGSEFITYYFELLSKSELTAQEELVLIEFAIKTINADEKVEYSEIKFFKAIRKSLKITDNEFLTVYPDLEIYIEDDLETESKLEKLVNNYLKTMELPKFEHIILDFLENE